jgi:Tfp pilus assembly protein PilN
MVKQLPKSINLLESTGQPLSTWDKIYDWVFKVGRYVIVVVEAVVIMAFVSRFILDREYNDLKDSLEAKADILEGKKQFEAKSRQIQKVLTSISQIEENQKETSDKLDDVLKNVPSNVSIISISVNTQRATMECIAPDYDTVNRMERDFRNDPKYTDVQIVLSKSGDEDSEVVFSFNVKFSSEVEEE